LHLTFEYASRKACIFSTGLLYLPLKPDVKDGRARERPFGLQLLLVWKDLFRTAGSATLEAGRVGRALHGAGAEGVPRSASTVWSVMA